MNVTSFKPTLGLPDATMVVAGSMIGSGIFIVSADILRYTVRSRVVNACMDHHRVYDFNCSFTLCRVKCKNIPEFDFDK